MKLSIIVPVYNVENYLEKCIESLINQNLNFKHEIILVNDGSTDNSEKIIEKYLKHEKIVYVNKKNGGLSDARNAGIKVSKGEYLGFVDSDDFIHENMYEKMMNVAVKNESDLVICGVSRVNIQDKELMNYIPKDESFEEVLNNAYACNKICRKTLFGDIQYPIGKHYEDIFTTPKIYLKSEKIDIVPEKLYYYLERPGAITARKDDARVLDIIDGFIEIKKYIDENLNGKKRENILKEFERCKIEMQNEFLLKTVSGYSIGFLNGKTEEIINKFKELDSWKATDYWKICFAKYFPKNYIKKIKSQLKL